MADIGERLGGDDLNISIDQPLRIIIGGPPHSGKSTLMNLLEDRFQYYQIPVQLLDLDLSAPTPLKTGFTEQREKRKWTSSLADEAKSMFEQAEGVQVVLGDSVGLISEINEIISQPADVAILLVSGGHGDYDTTYRKVVRKWKEYYEDIRKPLLVVLRSTMNPADESMFDPRDNYGVIAGLDRDAYQSKVISGHYQYTGEYPTNACLEGIVFEIAQSFDLKVRSATDPDHLAILNEKWPDLKDKKTWTPPADSMLGGIERAYFDERGRVPADQRAESFGADFKVGMDGDFEDHEEGDVGSEHLATYILDNGEKVEVFEGYTIMSKGGMNSGKRIDGYLIGIAGDNQWWQPEGGVPTRSEINSVFGAERYAGEDDLSFKEWADQEMLTHGKKESFDDWLDDELSHHGDNMTLQDWGQHELDSHYERYGAENMARFEIMPSVHVEGIGIVSGPLVREYSYLTGGRIDDYDIYDDDAAEEIMSIPANDPRFPLQEGELELIEAMVYGHSHPRINDSWGELNEDGMFWASKVMETLSNYQAYAAEDNLKELKAIYNPYIGKQVRFITKYGLDKDDMFVDIETIHSIDWDGGEDEYDEPVFLNKEGDRWMTLDYVKENLVENKEAEEKIHSQLMIGSLIGLGAGLWSVNRFKESREEK